MPKLAITDIDGVYTNADPDNVSDTKAESLKNFRPVNGKLVKTHGAGKTGFMPNLGVDLNRFTMNQIFLMSNERFTKGKHKVIAVKCDINTGRAYLSYEGEI